MLLNPIKTKIMIFNPLKKFDVLPLISTGPNTQIEVVEQHKILGQILRSDLRTISNTENICKKAYKKMWVLRRLKSLGCPIEELLVVLKQQIITICEVGAVWWGPMISISESNCLERVLKAGLHIIYQSQYKSFNQILKLSKLSSLRDRRVLLISRASKKAYKSEKFNTWFCDAQSESESVHPEPRVKPNTRQPRKPVPCTPLLKPVTCRTQRYARSSIPLMTRLLSWHPPLKYTAPDLA